MPWPRAAPEQAPARGRIDDVRLYGRILPIRDRLRQQSLPEDGGHALPFGERSGVIAQPRAVVRQFGRPVVDPGLSRQFLAKHILAEIEKLRPPGNE
jgi:hypothetical protein